MLILTPYTQLWETLAPGQLTANAELALVGFHSMFNALGVILILPFAAHFARFISAVIKSDGSGYADRLDATLLKEPAVAMIAIVAALQCQLTDMLRSVNAMFCDDKDKALENLPKLKAAIDETQNYVDLIHLKGKDDALWQQLMASIHILDHMRRLCRRCEGQQEPLVVAKKSPLLAQYVADTINASQSLISMIDQKQWSASVKLAKKHAVASARQRQQLREQVMSQIALGELTIAQATEIVEAARWLKRVNRHIARIAFHFSELDS